MYYGYQVRLVRFTQEKDRTKMVTKNKKKKGSKMSAKKPSKNTTPVTAPEEVDEVAGADEDKEDPSAGQMSLTPFELSQLSLHNVRQALQTSVIDKLKLEDQMLAIKYREDHAVIQGKLKGCKDSRTEAQHDYNGQIAEVEKRLGIVIAEYAIDDVTGTLRHEDEFN